MMQIQRTTELDLAGARSDINKFWMSVLDSGDDRYRTLLLEVADEVARLERIRSGTPFGAPMMRERLRTIGRSYELRQMDVPGIIMTLCGETVQPFDLHEALMVTGPICWQVLLTECWRRVAEHGANARRSLLEFGEGMLALAEDGEKADVRQCRARITAAIKRLGRLPSAILELGTEVISRPQLIVIACILRPTIQELLRETGCIHDTTPPPPPGNAGGNSCEGDEPTPSMRPGTTLFGFPVVSAAG
jgi:hypothetical protein